MIYKVVTLNVWFTFISVAEEPSTNAELHWYELEYNLGQLKNADF